MRISEIAHIQTGHQFRQRIEPDPAGTVGVIQIKDIADRRRLNPESIDRIEFKSQLAANQIQIGDVLFLSRGHNLFAVAIEDELINTIASGYFYIIRPHSHLVRGGYLAWYLNQPSTQDRFKQIAMGSHIPFISLSEFRELDIPVPSLNIQDRIIEIASLADQEQHLLRTIADRRAQLIQTICLASAESSPPRH